MELVKKYHPDKYQGNPLADLAQEKLQEVNEAYDLLMKSSGAGNGASPYGAQPFSGGYAGGSAYGSGQAGYGSGNYGSYSSRSVPASTGAISERRNACFSPFRNVPRRRNGCSSGASFPTRRG